MGTEFTAAITFEKSGLTFAKIAKACGGAAPGYFDPSLNRWEMSFVGSATMARTLAAITKLAKKYGIAKGEWWDEYEGHKDILPDGRMCPVVLVRVRKKV